MSEESLLVKYHKNWCFSFQCSFFDFPYSQLIVDQICYASVLARKKLSGFQHQGIFMHICGFDTFFKGHRRVPYMLKQTPPSNKFLSQITAGGIR